MSDHVSDYGLRAAEALPGSDRLVLRAIGTGAVNADEIMDSCDEWIELRLRQAQANLDRWNSSASASSDMRRKLTNPEPQWVERWKTL